MAALNSDERASAAQMLVKHFSGEGLCTPRNRVPDLTSGTTPILTVAKGPPPNLLSSTTQNLRRSRRLRQNGVICVGARYRITKGRGRPQANAARWLQGFR
ncbi:hypothetical protein F5B18DRAFT_626749 [Nemania serpens]|nr:hypothetical protein F5B18DRAFT_626749 [Nemania serpens]